GRGAPLFRHQCPLQLRSRSGSGRRVRSDRATGGRPARTGGHRRDRRAGGGRRRRAAMSLRFGYWLPVFGGWLRNVEDEGMSATWEYVRDLAVGSVRIGFDLTLIAELQLNSHKEPEGPAL